MQAWQRQTDRDRHPLGAAAGRHRDRGPAGALDRLRWTFRYKADGLDAAGLRATIGASTSPWEGCSSTSPPTRTTWSGCSCRCPHARAVERQRVGRRRRLGVRVGGQRHTRGLYALYDGAVARARARVAAAIADGGLDQRSRHTTARATTPTCVACCSTWSRSTAATPDTPTCSARPSTAASARTPPPAGSRVSGAWTWRRMTDHDENPGFDSAHRGATFRRFDFTEAVFDDTYLVNARFRNVALKGARISRGPARRRRDLRGGGAAHGQRRRRHRSSRPSSTAGSPTARRCCRTRRRSSARRRTSSSAGGARPSSRAGKLDPELLHERVDGEWSFIETQRHLGLRHRRLDQPRAARRPGPLEPARPARTTTWATSRGCLATSRRGPSLDEVLRAAARPDGRHRTRVSTGLTEEKLGGSTTPVDRAGLPGAGQLPGRRRWSGCIVNEEWYHHQYADRDLAVLESARHADADP